MPDLKRLEIFARETGKMDPAGGKNKFGLPAGKIARRLVKLHKRIGEQVYAGT
ncbi:MAG: hypothetical protein K9K64_11770 [Desulfohalobiaceae bacterium]|nr:hypothetical protein [Desulfohalobiaceae bacterium]